MTKDGPRSAVATSVASVISTVLPLFLLGAFAPAIRADLGIDTVGLGLLAGAFTGTQALTASTLGRVADALPPRTVLSLAVAVTTAVGVSVLTVGGDAFTFGLLLAVAGSANAAAQVASFGSLAVTVPARRRGIAFGVLQAAKPGAALIGGLLVGTVGATLDWRSAYGLASVLAFTVGILVFFAAPNGNAREHVGRKVAIALPRSLWLLGVSAGMAFATANILTTFVVDTATRTGISLAGAGALLTALSFGALTARIVAGVIVDRVSSAGRVAVVMFGIGSTGFLLIAVGPVATTVVGALIAGAFGWGYAGVLVQAVVEVAPSIPSRATGVVLAGGSLGAVSGPVLFGLVEGQFGLSTAWLATAIVAMVGALVLLTGLRATASSTTSRPEPGPAGVARRVPGRGTT